ncbi:fumarylacetoacetate hydrolase family protein [Pseudoxanthobacter sp. M-2]|uniref:fumarylacetoacetate hydrolase family protein n=1 Tax=Pseudoxanthobacter sp. M-2 TaxID=3078754 RepID=UPI0038FC55B8
MPVFSAPDVLPNDGVVGTLIARVFRPGLGPSVCVVRGDAVVDITSKTHPTVRDLCEASDPAAAAQAAPGEPIGTVGDIIANSDERHRDESRPWLLAPVDLQAVKACGVTFVESLLERVIEEQARGAPDRAAVVRAELTALIGTDLSRLSPGSEEAMRLKAALIERKAWSQYLEVGIGPDAEVFTKAQPLSAVGLGADVGVLASSSWNNPEPEIVLVVSSAGRIVGATLGNDVNLRDVEGRSALLLGKAKDNNASAAIGPFLRLFDATFSIDDVRAADLELVVEGEDGFRLDGRSSMRKISRSPESLVAAAAGRHHQYPDGFCLYLGTMFAPVKDRGEAGSGFTHHRGDVVRISTPTLGALVNRVNLSTECTPWTFGAASLMRNLASRGLL